MKRLIALFLSALIVLGVLAACGDGNETSNSSAGTQSAKPVSSDAASAGSDKTDVNTDTQTPSTDAPRTYDSVMSGAEHYVGLTDQKNHRLVVYDLAVEDWSKPEAVVWEYADERYTYHCAGIKFRHNDLLGGDVVIFCGPRGAGIVSYDTKELLFFSDDYPANPHTVELLPDGTFLCGGTQGQAIHAYNPLAGKTGRRTTRLVVPDGHGCLWDPEYELLWTAGAHNIDAYMVSGGPEKPTFTPVYKYSDLPSGIHDLAPVYGDTSKLWFTSSDGVLRLDKDSGKYDRTYPGSSYIGKQTYTPGVGNFPDGVLVWVTPNNCLQEWNTDYLSMYVKLDGIKHKKIDFKSTADAYYKCRVWLTDYQ